MFTLHTICQLICKPASCQCTFCQRNLYLDKLVLIEYECGVFYPEIVNCVQFVDGWYDRLVMYEHRIHLVEAKYDVIPFTVQNKDQWGY